MDTELITISTQKRRLLEHMMEVRLEELNHLKVDGEEIDEQEFHLLNQMLIGNYQ
jgi:hypothetical protein